MTYFLNVKIQNVLWSKYYQSISLFDYPYQDGSYRLIQSNLSSRYNVNRQNVHICGQNVIGSSQCQQTKCIVLYLVTPIKTVVIGSSLIYSVGIMSIGKMFWGQNVRELFYLVTPIMTVVIGSSLTYPAQLFS